MLSGIAMQPVPDGGKSSLYAWPGCCRQAKAQVSGSTPGEGSLCVTSSLGCWPMTSLGGRAGSQAQKVISGKGWRPGAAPERFQMWLG